jgi:hypothetical protein
MKNVCAFTRIQRKKKKEGYTPDSRMAAVVLGLKKAGRRERERGRDQASK